MIPRTLNSQIPIVDSEGRPTRYFMEVIQDTGEDVVSTADDLSAVEAAVAALTSSVSSLAVAVASLALDDLTDVDVTTTPPTNGQVLTFDSGDGLWKPATPSGGGGGLWYFSPPSAASFTTASGDAGSLTLTDDADQGLLVEPGSCLGTACRVAYITLTTPALAWEMVMRAEFYLPTLNYNGIGLFAQLSSSAKLMTHGPAFDGPLGGEGYNGYNYNSLTSWAGRASYISNFEGVSMNWLKLVSDGTSYYSSVSADGKIWHQIYTNTWASFLVSPPNRVGFISHNIRGALALNNSMSIQYFSLTGPAV